MGQVYRNANFEAARAGSWEPEMAGHAGRVLATVKAFIAPHSKSGRFEGSVQLAESVSGRGVRDFIVYSDEPEALHIEYGHLLTYQDEEGHTVYTDTWVHGIYPFNRAFDSLAGA